MMLMIAIPIACAGETGEVVASQDQLFLVNGSWIPASQIRLGDVFLTSDGRQAVVRDVQDADLDSNPCYAVATETPQSFYVNDVLARTVPSLDCRDVVGDLLASPNAETQPTRGPIAEAWKHLVASQVFAPVASYLLI